jgi:hypothetical protein
VAALLALAGCDVQREPPAEAGDGVFGEQVRALDDAKAVEALAEARRKKLEQAEEGRPDARAGD